MTAKFYTIIQNNSGGYFIVNDDVASNLIIEAYNKEDAISKMLCIVEDYGEYCECCGERWSIYDIEFGGGFEVPTVFGEDVRKHDNGSTIIYHLDGTKDKLWY